VTIIRTVYYGRPQAWARRRGAFAPWNCCKVFFCISSYSQTLSRLIIYALFSQFFVSTPFFALRGRFGGVGAVHVVVLACVLRATTIKRSSTFIEEKKCTPPGKILAMPMNLPSPGKNPAGTHVHPFPAWMSLFYIFANSVLLSATCMLLSEH